ncbi:hypothetical protein [Nostoc sp.]|uniref:hypothetical protein n=1 Tax=Nostoc sp. TaxID=1180 RepID=UPI002FF8DF00
MKQVSYLSQIANRVRPRSDRPSGDQVLLNPPRLLFHQGEENQTLGWGDETPLSDQALDSPLSQLSTSDIVSLQPVPLQTEAVTNLGVAFTDTKTQPPAPDVVRSTPDNQLSLKSLRQSVNKSVTGHDIRPQPAPPVAQFSSQAEAGTISQVSLEGAAIASLTPNLKPSLVSSPPSRHEAIADADATVLDPRLLSQTDKEPLTTTLEPTVHSPSTVTIPEANLPVQPLRTTLEPSLPMQSTQTPGIAESVRSSALPQRPTVHIGAIEIQISPPPVTLPTPTAKTATRAAPPATASLSRGFTSTFGLRQG